MVRAQKNYELADRSRKLPCLVFTGTSQHFVHQGHTREANFLIHDTRNGKLSIFFRHKLHARVHQ